MTIVFEQDVPNNLGNWVVPHPFIWALFASEHNPSSPCFEKASWSKHLYNRHKSYPTLSNLMMPRAVSFFFFDYQIMDTDRLDKGWELPH